MMQDTRIVVAMTLLVLAMGAIGAAAWTLLRETHEANLRLRLQTVLRGQLPQPPVARRGIAGGFLQALLQLGNVIRRRTHFYADDQLYGLQQSIAAIGLQPRTVVPMIVGAKLMLTLLAPIAAYAVAVLLQMSPTHQLVTVIAAVPVGLLAPDLVVGLLRRRYMAAIRRGVPDAVDLLVVCAEAGMSFGGAIEQVAVASRQSNPAIAVVFATLADELRLLPDRRAALLNFGRRAGVEGLQKLATAITQALDYGTPLGNTMRILAADMRRQSMIRLEERATRLPALLVLPLVMFILPALLVVLAGPSLLRLIDAIGAVRS